MATTIERIQLRRDTAANWTTANPTLAAGELGFETDTGRFKLGTGAAAWSSLGYASILPGAANSVTNAMLAGSIDDTKLNTISTAGKVSGSAITSGNIASSGGFTSSSATAGIGYATGAGGTVTQATSKTTGVTLNNITGRITLSNASLAAATIVSFTLTNSAIAATDLLVLNHVSGGTLGAYTINAAAAAGSATIHVRNNTAGALAEAIVIGFAVIKAVTA